MAEHYGQFEVYCQNDRCGDPVPALNGNVYFTKRKMAFAGLSFTGAYVYRCPVCGAKRKFREGFWDGCLNEV